MLTDIPEQCREEIRNHLRSMTESRKQTMHLAHDEFNRGVKWATDFMMEFINTYRLNITKED